MSVFYMISATLSLALGPFLYTNDDGAAADLSIDDGSQSFRWSAINGYLVSGSSESVRRVSEINSIFDEALQRMDEHENEYLRNKKIVEDLVTRVWAKVRRTVPLLRSSYIYFGGSNYEGCRMSNISDFDAYLITFSDLKDRFQTTAVKIANSEISPVVHRLNIPADPALLRKYPELRYILDSRGIEIQAKQYKIWMYAILYRALYETIPQLRSRDPRVVKVVPSLGESSLNIAILLKDGAQIDLDLGALIQANMDSLTRTAFISDYNSMACPLKLNYNRDKIYIFSPQGVRHDKRHLGNYTDIFSVDAQAVETDILLNNEVIQTPVRLLKSIRKTRGWEAWNVKAYVTKHIVLHTFNQTCQQLDWKNRNNLPAVIGECLTTTEQAFQRGYLPHFFTRGLNVLGQVEESDLPLLARDGKKVLNDFMSGKLDKISSLFVLPLAY